MVTPYDPTQAAVPPEESRFKLSSDPGFLQALSGFASGNNVGEQFASVNNILAGNAEKQKQEQIKTQTLGLLESKSPEIAAALKAGTISPSEAFKTYLAQRAAANEAAQPKRSFQKLDDGTYGFSDENAGTFDKLGTVQKPIDIPASVQEYEYAVKTQGFTGSLQDWQEQKAKLDDGKPSDKFKTELETMKAYRGEDPVETFRATRDAYEKVRTSAGLSTAQGDIGLVYGFMKMLDPTSVVREGEFATAQNSGGIDETVYNIYNKAISGQRLTPEQRQKFVEAAEAQYRNTEKNLQAVNSRYKGLADAYDVPADRFLEVPKAYPPLKIGDPPADVVLPGGKKATIKKISD